MLEWEPETTQPQSLCSRETWQRRLCDGDPSVLLLWRRWDNKRTAANSNYASVDEAWWMNERTHVRTVRHRGRASYCMFLSPLYYKTNESNKNVAVEGFTMKPSFYMKHLFLLILLAEPLSGNNMFLSAWPCQTSVRKTVGHNYPVCSEAQCFLLFKSPRAVKVLRSDSFPRFSPCCVRQR